MERERHGDYGFNDPAELSRIKAEVSIRTGGCPT